MTSTPPFAFAAPTSARHILAAATRAYAMAKAVPVKKAKRQDGSLPERLGQS